MAEKLGQTEENCNLGNTKEIDNEVGEKREEEKGKSNIIDAYVNLKDFKNTIKYLEIYLKFSKEVGDRTGEGKAYGKLGNTITVLEISRKPKSTMNDTSKFPKKWGTGQEKE